MPEQPLATLEKVLEGGLEIPCVPRVCDFAAVGSKRHHQTDFLFSVVAENAVQPAHIAFVHTYQQVELVIILPTHLTGSLSRVESHAVLCQTTFCRRMNPVARFLGRHRRRFDVKQFFAALRLHQSLHNKLRHC